MFKRIVTYCIFAFLLIALVLKIGGINKVEFNDSYYSFFQKINGMYSTWRLDIPNIPQLPSMVNTGGFVLILNAFISFANGIVTIVNIVVLTVNFLINVIQFILTIFSSVVWFRDYLL